VLNPATHVSTIKVQVDWGQRNAIMARYHARAAAFATAGQWPAKGDGVWPADVARAALELRPRQLDVLRLVADGFSNREIANRLWISEETVKSHIREILVRLRAECRSHAVAIGFRHGLLA
jgi:DNA-binding NarL/FixJ family response regulator